VEAGERLAIIGPNGAGKTTLFNVLNGQLTVSSGRVYLFGRDITRMPAHQRAHLGIARSFQLTTLFLSLTVLENVLLALHGGQPSLQMFHSPTDGALTKARHLLDLMGLWEKRNDAVSAISYGEQRKLEIALSLAPGPRLLLLDEPSSGLTSAESAEITDMIRNLGKDITVILVAHDMDLVFGVAQRIIVLHLGEIITEGTCDKISVDPKVREIYIGDMDTTGKCLS